MVEMFNFVHKISLKGFTLIIPSVAVGNVPQLTIDLVVSTHNCKKVATIWHPAIVSSVGADPYVANGPEICTACELYADENAKIALIQLRSTIDFKLATKFFADLKRAIIDHHIKDVVILTSSFDHEMHNIKANKFYYITNQEIHDLMSKIEIAPKPLEYNNKYMVHGGGFAVKLFEVLEQIPCTVIIKYVSEGDNRPDAINTLQRLTKFVNGIKESLPIETITFPSSWNCIFGGPPPVGMY